jgi:membrane protease YdiL (CAAX protease family)
MSSSSLSGSVRVWKVPAFLGLTFGLSWLGAASFAIAGVDLGSLTGTVLVVVVYMWAPAIAAISIQRWDGESIRTGCGLRRGRLRWVGLAWVTPIGLLALTIGISVAFPGVSFTTDYGAFLRGLGLPEAQVEASLAALDGVPIPPPVFFVLQGLVGGLTINAVAALGEELGWRGLLLRELSPLGFWRLSLLTSVVWGVWHAPLIVQGHNFPDAPFVGIAVMTGWTVAASPLFTYLTVRASSVLAPTLLHGSFNAVASLSLVYLTGAGNLLLAPVGAAGVGAALFATGLCVVHDRYLASERLTSGGPIDPW